MIKVNVTKFRSHYADANPEWLVTEKRGRGTWIATVIDCPDYAGAKQAFTTEQINGSINMSKLWENLANEGENFYTSLPIGTIVHYSNGQNQYVRCKVTSGNNLLPIALVGAWQPYDLPRRMGDGTIYNGYHCDSIKNGKVFKPHASNVYEYNLTKKSASAQPFGFKNWTDPRGLTPLNFDVPPMTPEEEMKAAKVRTVNQIQNICGQDMTAEGKLNMIRNILDPDAL